MTTLFIFKLIWICLSDNLVPSKLFFCGIAPGQNTGMGSHSLFQGIFPTQGSKPGFPPLQADSLPAEPPGKTKNIGMSSLSLLQQIFLTQELNQDLLHFLVDSLPAKLPGKPQGTAQVTFVKNDKNKGKIHHSLYCLNKWLNWVKEVI